MVLVFSFFGSLLGLAIGFLEVGWVDVVDVLLVSTALYLIFRLMRGTFAFRISLGVLLLYFLYLIVKAARMELLTIILGQFSGLGVLVLVILFQQEIRRFLFLLGQTPSLGRRNRWIHILTKLFALSESTKKEQVYLGEILDALEEMSEARTGGLVVVSRDELVGELERSGDVIDARLSKGLLLSIFNRNSPLHDGAVVVRGNRINMARCMLPLSKSDLIPPQYGTRHRAAVGFSEQCDALVLVVSEETGHLSAAFDGNLHEIHSLDKLRQVLTNYLDEAEKPFDGVDTTPVA